MGKLTGKVALVTGAARGQGRSHAIGLAQDGADVIALDICGPIRNLPYVHATPEELSETANAVKETGQQVITAQVDVRDKSALVEAIDDAVASLGRLDIAVANAGICIPGAWDAISQEVWQDTLDVNLTGVWNTATAALPHMIAAGGGSLMLVSSAAGLRGQPFLGPYVASKFGVTGIAQMLSLELASKQVRVNSIHPGPLRSAMGSGNTGMMELIEASPKIGLLFQNAMDVPFIEPEDVSHAVRFLASDDARYITGLAMSVDAGNSKM